MTNQTLLPQGIIPAMVTPLSEAGKINESSLRRLTNRMIEAGVHGLFPIGSQGEFWALSAAEKQQVWQIVAGETDGRLPVYGGTAAITTREVIDLNRRAEDSGLNAVSILTPYFLSPSQEELYDHYAAIAAATELPILLYGNPARTGVSLSVDLVRRLSQIENIVGIKDSSGQLALTAGYIGATSDDFSVLMGNDALIFGALAYGAKGAIAATANIVPKLVVKIFTAYIAGDLAESRRAQAALAPLRGAFGWGTFPVVIKEALDLMGEAGGPARKPVGPMSQETRQRLQAVLAELGVI